MELYIIMGSSEFLSAGGFRKRKIPERTSTNSYVEIQEREWLEAEEARDYLAEFPFNFHPHFSPIFLD
jgi:hypothetical protein